MEMSRNGWNPLGWDHELVANVNSSHHARTMSTQKLSFHGPYMMIVRFTYHAKSRFVCMLNSIGDVKLSARFA